MTARTGQCRMLRRAFHTHSSPAFTKPQRLPWLHPLLLVCYCSAFQLGCESSDDSVNPPGMESPVPQTVFGAKDDSFYFDEHQSSERRDQVCRERQTSCEAVCRSSYQSVLGRLFPFLNACTRQCREDAQTCIQRANVIHGSDTDGESISWGEPDAEGVGGYFGFCGPTAAANLVANMCGQSVSPRTFASESFSWGPGTSPERLARALNSLGRCGTWAQCQTTAGVSDPLTQVAQRLPVGVLVTWSARSLHWVTVVDVTRTPACTVVFNHQGRQDRLSCDSFVELWGLGETLAGRVAVATGILQPFTFVCQVSE